MMIIYVYLIVLGEAWQIFCRQVSLILTELAPSLAGGAAPLSPHRIYSYSSLSYWPTRDLCARVSYHTREKEKVWRNLGRQINTGRYYSVSHIPYAFPYPLRTAQYGHDENDKVRLDSLPLIRIGSCSTSNWKWCWDVSVVWGIYRY
ncbi:hypothetical protein HOY80DRAFT_573274 [Tuber brumale]|nr:hypothetical protein HOY80DRAFT_573274 [Tuber brumale]